MSALGLALAGLLALSSAQEPKAQEPRRAPVVGEVELSDWVTTKAKVISLEAQLKDCQQRLERKHFLLRFFRLLFAKR